MSDLPSLSEGFIKAVTVNPDSSNPTPAILQVLSIKPINSDKGVKYRMILSDGKNFTEGILSTQLNGMVENDTIKKFTVIHARKFVINQVSDKKILFVLDIDIVDGDCTTKIGSPQEVEAEPEADQGPTPPASPAPSPLPSPQKSPVKPSNLRAPNFAPGSPEKSTEVIPISSLNPYQGRWSIKARVSNKSDVRTWSNAKGNGKLFSLTLVDETGEIKATGFTDVVEKFYNQIEVGKIYIFSRGSIKPAKKQYSNIKNDYEITFDQFTTIKLSDDQSADVPEVFFKFVPISSLSTLQKDSVVDIIAVVKEAGDATTLVTKYQKELSKRDLQLVDQGLQTVKVTLWGSLASDFNEKGNPVVAIKGVRVSDYGGVSLSTLSSSVVQINPKLPEAQKLQTWFDEEGHSATFVPLTVQNSNSSSMDSSQRKTVKDVEAEKLGSKLNQPDTFNLKATVVTIPHEKMFYYTADPETGAKVVQTSSGWFCERTNKTIPNCEYRYIMKTHCLDSTGGMWLNLFNDSAQTIMQKSALDLHLMKEEGQLDEFEDSFKNAMFKSYVFRVKAKSEIYQGDQFTRYQVVGIKPLDFVNESKNLIASIKQYS